MTSEPHTHDERYMNQTETNRLINMFQASLSSINATLAGLDSKLDSYAMMPRDVTDIKTTLGEINGSVKDLRLWRSEHKRHHELVDTEEAAYRKGRASVVSDIHIGWKVLLAAVGGVQVVGGAAVALYFALRAL